MRRSPRSAVTSAPPPAPTLAPQPLPAVDVAHADFANPSLWLCRPGLADDKCKINLDATIIATDGTQKWAAAQGIAAKQVNKVYEGRPNIVDMLKDGEIALVFNTTEGAQAISDSRDIRRVALMDKIAYFTTAAAAVAAVEAMQARSEGYRVRTLQG